MYVGTDPLTRRQIRIKATAKTEQQAHIELGRPRRSACCYRPRHLHIRRLNYLGMIWHGSVRIVCTERDHPAPCRAGEHPPFGAAGGPCGGCPRGARVGSRSPARGRRALIDDGEHAPAFVTSWFFVESELSQAGPIEPVKLPAAHRPRTPAGLAIALMPEAPQP